MTRQVLISLALFHFVIIILHNVVSMADGIEAVYGPANRTEPNRSVLSTLRKVIHHKSIHHYSRKSGAETGFGFFAPQVGNQYLSFFSVYDEDDKLIEEYHSPLLKQQESWNRYATFLDLYQATVGKEKDHLNQRYARSILHSMGERLGLQIKEANHIICQIHAFRYPTLNDYQTQPLQNATLVPLFETIIYLDHD